jgi:hypothetical protein
MAIRKEKLLTRAPSQVEVVTLAVFLLGGGQRPIDTEDVAIRAHELAPGRFAWRKYPEQINLELIRVYLSDAKKSEKGAYLNGSGRDGWTLTPRGLAWAERFNRGPARSQLARARAESRAGSVDEVRWRRERARILATAAWARWSRGDRDIPSRDAREVYRIDSYALGRALDLKITRLRDRFRGDSELDRFLSAMAELVTE